MNDTSVNDSLSMPDRPSDGISDVSDASLNFG